MGRGRRGLLAAAVGAAGLLSGCSALPVDDLQPLVELGPNVTVPASWVRPVDTCMHDAGFVAAAVHEGRTGTNEKYGYSWEAPAYFTWEAPVGEAPGAALACRHAFAPYQDKTEDELQAIYERWTRERLCLMDFGYAPPEPPSFEEFKSTWHTGPWMPVDGITIALLNPKAQESCGLEMLD